MTPRIPEKHVQRQIVCLLERIGAKVYVLGTTRPRGDYPGTMQTPGVPDLYVFLPETPQQWRGLAVWIEVKAKGGRLRPAQADFRDRCQVALTPHLVGGLDEVVHYLTAGGWLKGSTAA